MIVITSIWFYTGYIDYVSFGWHRLPLVEDDDGDDDFAIDDTNFYLHSDVDDDINSPKGIR